MAHISLNNTFNIGILLSTLFLAIALNPLPCFSCDLMVVLKETTLYKDAVDKPSGKEIVKTMLQPGTVLLPSKAHSTGKIAVIYDNCLFVQHWAACEFQDSVTQNGRTEVICLVEDNKWSLGWVELNDNVIRGTYQDRAQLKSCAGGPPKQILDPSCYLTAAKTLFDSGTLALQKKQELASLIEKATNGQQDAQYELGIRYYYGMNNDLDTAKGIEWLSKAGEGGYLLAQNKLASLFSTGDKALPQDKVKALYWTIKSAEQGQTQSMALVGKAYLEGAGTAKDFSKAFLWTKKAAEAGDVASENMLGVLYHNGQGTEKNVEEAKKWWLLAANQGSKEAKQNLEYSQREVTISNKGVADPRETENTARPTKEINIVDTRGANNNNSSVTTLGVTLETVKRAFQELGLVLTPPKTKGDQTAVEVFSKCLGIRIGLSGEAVLYIYLKQNMGNICRYHQVDMAVFERCIELGFGERAEEAKRIFRKNLAESGSYQTYWRENNIDGNIMKTSVVPESELALGIDPAGNESKFGHPAKWAN
ncbi:MAG TPA: tetratricopeptide repeat protein [Acidobacteriota bacterium]|nr:tetratricopeptide repeat protein [Acidobacteriota bacterium]HNT18623.1 tetratricopeptide repeat protein [Acidobacteriota bacterium]